jgi:hypothetical protein
MRTSNGAQQQATSRQRPLVWVKQIVLFETIEPLVEIRKIPFTMGMNIVQGESSESDDTFESGHGVGKTTVCRLIRYCLGEKSFGQKHLVEEVKHCIPKAHVGAVVEVAGADWAVLRPLGHRGREWALKGVDLNGLIGSEGPKRYDAFLDKLKATVLSNVPVNASLSGSQTLDWLHVLAMCSRDQESRYDLFWNWRHTRSDSGWPKFGKPKVDAGLCVRALLGLLDPEEPRCRAKLEELEAALAKTQVAIKDKKAEPAFHITRLRNSLAEFGVSNAAQAPLEQDHLFGLSQAVEVRTKELRQEVAQIDAQLAPLDRQINLAAASILEPAELRDQFRTASEVTEEGNAVLLNDLDSLRTIRQLIRDAEHALCRYGNVLIGECSIVQARQGELDREIREQQQATLPIVQPREQAAAQLREQAERQQAVIRRIQEHLDALNRQRDDILERRRSLNEQIRRIPLMLNEARSWNSVLEGQTPNSNIQALEAEAKSIEAEIDATKHKLTGLLAAQAERIKLFESRFDAVVRGTLTTAFKGVIGIGEEGIDFSIKRGESLSGEAYETLAVLLADVALLFESYAANVHHPGLLLHDSPREADLNLRIYQRLLDTAHAQMEASGQNGDIPFQYIVTTTTTPSKQLQRKAITKVKLSGGSGSLFGRQLQAPAPVGSAPSLFDTDEEDSPE